MSPTVPRDLPAFLSALEAAGELRRIKAQVSGELEITEIACRMARAGGPALLFERIQGSPYPLAINILASPRRIAMALGREPAEVGQDFARLLERLNPPTARGLLECRGPLWRILQMRQRRAFRAPCQEVSGEPNLLELPALKCWPGDGGRFLTWPLVLTRGADGRRNLGLYRMHIFSADSTGMHWQIQKGGGFHHHQAEAQGRSLPVAVAIGADPALLIAAMAPLPEGIDEVAFSGFLRGRPTPMVRARSVDLDVPADAEFVLEGEVPPGERRTEGPFGDHYGHYSAAAPFPVFHVRTLTRKRHPVYHAAVVGKPPLEDLHLGNAVQEMFGPLLKAAHPEVRDAWAYGEGGFHTLLVVSVGSRYGREGLKSAMGLLGDGQLSLTKMVVVVGADTPARDFRAVLRAIRRNFDPARDFILLPGTAMDTLDFSSFRRNLGSKMILDATGDLGPAPSEAASPPLTPEALRGLGLEALGVERWKVLEDTLLALRLPSRSGRGARKILEGVLARPEAGSLKMVVALSADVDLEDPMQLLWGWLTRFEPARDVLFAHSRLEGVRPIHEGPLAIDATHKEGYPAPLEMDPEIVVRVDRRWGELFPGLRKY